MDFAKRLTDCAIGLVADTCAGDVGGFADQPKNDKAWKTAWDVRTPCGQSPVSGALILAIVQDALLGVV